MELEVQSFSEKELQLVRDCEENIGYRFKDPQLLVQALNLQHSIAQ